MFNFNYMPLYDTGSVDKKDVARKIELMTAEIRPQITDVIFSGPATIVKWSDGTKTIVKCGEGDTYDKEKGLMMAIVKKYYGNVGDWYRKKIDKWMHKEPSVKKQKKKHDEDVKDLLGLIF